MEFLQANPSQEADILDFINYVFSNAHVPHDFKKLLPFVYGKEGFYKLHSVALENGKIKGVIAMLPFLMRVGGESLKAGFIGSVSVHPYERGRGIMKGLMECAHSAAEKQQLDLVFLSGRRHRYKYFGYERIGAHFNFTLNEDSLRHALKSEDISNCSLVPFDKASKDEISKAYGIYLQKQLVCAERTFKEFTAKASSWNNSGFVFIKDGKVQGYFIKTPKNSVEELCVNEESIRLCLKSICAHFGNVQIICPAWNKALFSEAEKASEGYQMFSRNMVRIYNWENVLNAAIKLSFKQRALKNQRAVFSIENAGTFCIEAKDAKAYKTNEKASIAFTQEEAASLFFSPISLFSGQCSAFYNWLPMHLELTPADGF
jgi:predicted acetyltransferase